MAEPTLAALFGANATQDATTITILKADLAATGLTPDAANKAESLLLAIFLHAKQALTPESLDTNLDQSISIEDPTRSTDRRGDNDYLQQTYQINVQKIDISAAIGPDDL